MKLRALTVAVSIAVAVGVAVWMLAQGTRMMPAAEVPQDAQATSEVVSDSPRVDASPMPAAATDPPPTPVGSPAPAWKTMAEAREQGDERAPPIERPSPEAQAPAPTAWDLSSPERYREYERRGHANLRAEYLVAVEAELPKWKALLAQARTTGAPRAAIREMEEKIRHLEQRQVILRGGAAPSR
jgi:hypothetical protein